MKVGEFRFPLFSGIRVLMMPFIQGDAGTLPPELRGYSEFVENYAMEPGEVGYLTVDEKIVYRGEIHRGARSEHDRAVHTEAGLCIDDRQQWHYYWGGDLRIPLFSSTQILIANNIDFTCAVWEDSWDMTSRTGDLGAYADDLLYENAEHMLAGEVYQIGVLQPHECLPVARNEPRQFVRLVGRGVHGRSNTWTSNPLMAELAG